LIHFYKRLEMSALARRRNQEEGQMCIPGLGENSHRPMSGVSRSTSVAAGSGLPGGSSGTSSPRPATAPVMTDRRVYNRRTANQGGASDSSQMSCLMWQPLSPVEPVKESVFVETKAEEEVGATPFFSSDTGVILIKGGTVVNCDEMTVADVLVEDGKISAVGEDLEIPEGATIIDATDKYVMPGGIDTNTHLYQGLDKDAPVKDDFESGTTAALAGGTTMVVDLVIPQRGESLMKAFHEWKEAGEEKSSCDFALTVAVPHVNDDTKEEMTKLANEHGVNSFKMFMSYKDKLMLDNNDLMKAFKHVKGLGCIAKIHAENGSIIDENQKQLLAQGVTGPEGHLLAQPEDVEEEAVLRACVLAKQVNTPLYICSPTSQAAGNVIKQYQDKGLVVYGEPSVAGLSVVGDEYDNKSWDAAAALVTSPPLRPGNHRDSLLHCLVDGSFVSVGSDHCAYSSSTRAAGRDDFTAIPQGVGGIAERLWVVYQRGVVEGKMSMTRYVEVTSSNAAKLLNIFPRKGCLAVGSDADIVVWNPDSHHTNTENQESIFSGLDMRGAVEYVVFRGKVVVAGNVVNTIPGTGQYVQARTFPSYCFDKIQKIDSMEKPKPVERDDIPADNDKPDDTKDDFGLVTPRGCWQQEVYNKQLGIYQRALSVHGVRNQQDSSFSLSGPQGGGGQGVTGSVQRRASVRVSNPPGGQGRAFW